MTTWGEYRTQLRRSVLKDPNQVTWSDDILRDLMGWALDTFCAHTAVATGMTYSAVTGTTVAIPDNVFGDLEATGLVYLQTTPIQVAEPQFFQDQSPKGTTYFYSLWGNQLVFNAAPGCDVTLRYFAYYDRPVLDSDVVACPQWAESALTYLIGAYALTSIGVQSANISQWDEKGNEENNALRAQQKYFMGLYEDALRRHSPQDRKNFYRRLL